MIKSPARVQTYSDTNGVPPTITEQITELMQDRPAFNAPDTVREGWLKRRDRLLTDIGGAHEPFCVKHHDDEEAGWCESAEIEVGDMILRLSTGTMDGKTEMFISGDHADNGIGITEAKKFALAMWELVGELD